MELFTFRRVVLPLFYLFCVSLFGFAHLRLSHWLKVLITYIISVEVFSMFRQDWVVQFLITVLEV
jgi:hypothetical protein